MNDMEITWLLLLDNIRDHAVFLSACLFSTLFVFYYRRRNGYRQKADSSKTPPRSVSPASEKRRGPPLHILPPSRRGTFEVKGLEDVSSPIERTKEEIASFGDFPDYSKFSGVRLPNPYPEFDIDKAKPRPYRPFRWAYHQTMSLSKMEPDWWLELESTYVERLKDRLELFEKHGKDVLDALPGCEAACKELMEMIIQFLCARYPQYFSFDRDTNIFQNKILDKSYDVKSMPPLHVIAQNVPEDFAIVQRNPETGKYTLYGGNLCSALGWNMRTKIGLSLAEIHAPIPDYKEKMAFSMDRYFSKMPADKPIQRGSWGLEKHTGKDLLYMPPGDPHEELRKVQDPDLELENIHLRVDWQTLRRLPLSNAIVFNFKALFTPMTEFRDEPKMPALLVKILEEGKASIMDYKGTWHIQHKALPALREWAEEQRSNGLCPEDWEPRTLDETPFFKGWEEKWHRQQGF